MSKLTFVLPTKNRIEWLPQCLETLRIQTEKDIEIIVVNDGSNDGTKEYLESDFVKADPRIRVVHNEQSIGAGKSRNLGADLATSPIIAVCDDDDEIPEDRAEATLRWFSEHPESELVNFPYIRIGYFGEHLEPFYGSQFDHEGMKTNGTVNYFCNPSAAYKKESAKEIGGYESEDKTQTDDVQFIQKWVNAGKKVDFDNRIFGVLHRVLPDSMMALHRGFKAEWASQ